MTGQHYRAPWTKTNSRVKTWVSVKWTEHILQKARGIPTLAHYVETLQLENPDESEDQDQKEQSHLGPYNTPRMFRRVARNKNEIMEFYQFLPCKLQTTILQIRARYFPDARRLSKYNTANFSWGIKQFETTAWGCSWKQQYHNITISHFFLLCFFWIDEAWMIFELMRHEWSLRHGWSLMMHGWSLMRYEWSLIKHPNPMKIILMIRHVCLHFLTY